MIKQILLPLGIFVLATVGATPGQAAQASFTAIVGQKATCGELGQQMRAALSVYRKTRRGAGVTRSGASDLKNLKRNQQRTAAQMRLMGCIR